MGTRRGAQGGQVFISIYLGRSLVAAGARRRVAQALLEQLGPRVRRAETLADQVERTQLVYWSAEHGVHWFQYDAGEAYQIHPRRVPDELRRRIPERRPPQAPESSNRVADPPRSSRQTRGGEAVFISLFVRDSLVTRAASPRAAAQAFLKMLPLGERRGIKLREQLTRTARVYLSPRRRAYWFQLTGVAFPARIHRDRVPAGLRPLIPAREPEAPRLSGYNFTNSAPA